ncbi:MAG: M23 family metallopeptidase [Rhodospirillales bacterium]|nr:M23 family metallopeptidase [Rhodospirillales bacterium]
MSSPTRPQIREALRTLVADKRYRDFNHPEHDVYVAHVSGEFKRVYPGPYVPGGSHMYVNDPEGGPEAIVHVRAYSQNRDGNVVEVSDHDRAAPGTGADAPTGNPSSLPKMSNPVPGGVPRGKDGWGDGRFGAGRADHIHRGVDIVVTPGQTVQSPVDGKVTRTDVSPYKGDDVYGGVEIETSDGHKVKMFYMKPDVKVGAPVKVGDPIGSAQDISKRYPDKGNGPMAPHVHVEVWESGKPVDPTGGIFGGK